jgi:CTP:molybdopterin cytidylyltransferase MocA
MRDICILLAAGKSERTGNTPKGLIPMDGKPWIVRQCEAIQRTSGCNVRVVLGYHEDKYRTVLGNHYETVVNPDPSRGQQSSIHCGLEGVKNYSAFVLPIDVPCPKAAVWERLRSNLADKWAVIPTCEGKGGHPVLLSKETFGFEGRLDQYLHSIPKDRILRVPVDDATVCENWNVAEKYATRRTSGGSKS